jgi:hypothetical protein
LNCLLKWLKLLKPLSKYTSAISSRTIFHLNSFFTKLKITLILLLSSSSVSSTKLYDADGELVGKVRDKAYMVNKTLDFSKMPKGEYTFRLSVSGEVFIEKLSI